MHADPPPSVQTYLRRSQRIALLWERDGPGCFYCGVALTQDEAILDHFVPRSRGGTDGLDNRRVACLACDTEKRDHLPVDFTPGETTLPDRTVTIGRRVFVRPDFLVVRGRRMVRPPRGEATVRAPSPRGASVLGEYWPGARRGDSLAVWLLPHRAPTSQTAAMMAASTRACRRTHAAHR